MHKPGDAPAPRRHYASPEDLRDDHSMDLAARVTLLAEWQDEVDHRLASESEGMNPAHPISAEHEAKLANEARRVSAALADLRREHAAAEDARAG